jgi:hypothetical protein
LEDKETDDFLDEVHKKGVSDEIRKRKREKKLQVLVTLLCRIRFFHALVEYHKIIDSRRAQQSLDHGLRNDDCDDKHALIDKFLVLI